MKEDTIDIELPAERSEGTPRGCQMSQELFQNASQTMGELRDWMRATGVSWDCLSHQMELARHTPSPLDKALDNYSTGLGKTLSDKPSNVW